MSEQISNILSTHDEIIKSIFIHLTTIDLINVSLVCKSWNRVATKLRKKCTKLQVTIKELREENRESFESDVNYFDDCMDKNGIPNFSLTFINQELYQRYLDHINNKTDSSFEHSKVHYMLKQCIPYSCPSVLLPCTLCVSEQLKVFDYRFFREPPPLDQVYITTSFPEIKNVTIQSYEVIDIENIVIDNVSNLRCIILFVKSNASMEHIEKFILNVKKCSDTEIGIFTEYTEIDVRPLKIITFSGDIIAKSVYVPGNLDGNEIQERFQNLKSGEISKGKSLALMFPQKLRENIYQTDIQRFQEVFPNTEVVGMKCSFIYKLRSDLSLETETPQRWPWCGNDPIYQNGRHRLAKPTQVILFSWN